MNKSLAGDIRIRARAHLNDLEESINALAHKQTPEGVRDSAGMNKLKRFLEEAGTTGTAVNSFLGKLSDGVDLVQKLGRRYNDIAEWCGSPQIPRILLGKDA